MKDKISAANWEIMSKIDEAKKREKEKMLYKQLGRRFNVKKKINLKHNEFVKNT